MTRNWGNLSDYEFEQLVGDLLGAELMMRFERFTRGRDGGIDLRYIPDGRTKPHVVQAKHYQGSRYSDLRRAATTEARRLTASKMATASYRLVTSLGLTPANKKDLASILSPWVTREDRIIGRDDLEISLDAHTDVERRHIKLWLGSSTQLASYIQAGVRARSRVLAQDIVRTLPLYVQGQSFGEALERLEDAHVLLVSGPPGVGKTTLARMAVGTCIAAGYEPVEVSRDIDEAWDTWDPDLRQVFLYDDFLGRTMLGELSKNEDSRLLSFIREVAASPRSRLVMTTREYILNEADRTFEAFRRNGLTRTRFLLNLQSYTPVERARILHNHVWHSDLSLAAKEELVADRGYRRIVQHQNFNPRLIEFVTGLQSGHPVSVPRGKRWIDFAVNSLDHPEEIWRQAYERELGDIERSVLLCLATMPDEAEVGDLERAFAAWERAAGRSPTTSRFENALKVLDDSFTSSLRREGDVLFCKMSNPGLNDFVSRQVGRDPQLVARAAQSAVFLEQLERLWRLMDFGTRATLEVVCASTDFADAVERVFEQPGTRWVRFVDHFAGDHYGRFDQTPDERLIVLLRIADGSYPLARMAETVGDLLSKRVGLWRDGTGESGAAVGLARNLMQVGLVPVPNDWKDALAHMAVEAATSVPDWQGIMTLTDLLPDQFPVGTTEVLADSFREFASDELSNYGYDDFGSEDDLDALQVIAADLGTELDEQQLEGARERLSERSSRDDDVDEDDWFRGRSYDSGGAGDAAEMDAIFSRLTD